MIPKVIITLDSIQMTNMLIVIISTSQAKKVIMYVKSRDCKKDGFVQ